MNRLGLAAIGYTPDDKVPRQDEGKPLINDVRINFFFYKYYLMNVLMNNYKVNLISVSDYWSESDQEDLDGTMTLKQDGPSSHCDSHHQTSLVSSSKIYSLKKIHSSFLDNRVY